MQVRLDCIAQNLRKCRKRDQHCYSCKDEAESIDHVVALVNAFQDVHAGLLLKELAHMAGILLYIPRHVEDLCRPSAEDMPLAGEMHRCEAFF
eukprot:CAMPEP_0181396874 /NCGR_PEP_ID=MMETSP1110-20121109/152_1 /TAXON_ID=174948 /ORGANISM="Symbiodinium sp., Strain CCMP421" /LENGTH=92 /DNA_ID=CAMNT_0023518611 /DNA_START=268 /DNA_END=546 /DNA_ORIENTATION=+